MSNRNTRTGYMVKEIFGPTIQGEGSCAGMVVTFLRFAGCNRWSGREQDRAKSICKFCDTDFRGGRLMTPREILEHIERIGVKRVVISGGEPTLQIDEQLVRFLFDNGIRLHLETNGSKSLEKLGQYFDHISMSPKQGRAETKLKHCNDIKILWPPISDEITPEKFESFECTSKIIQPVEDSIYESNLASAVEFIKNNPTWKLGLQLHKVIGEK